MKSTSHTSTTNASVCVATYLPSPYQVELFNAIQLGADLDLTVIYLKEHEAATPIARHWSTQTLAHRAIVLRENPETLQQAGEAIESAGMVVFNYYRHPAVLGWIRQRAASGKPWCFWGERPGFRFSGILGRLYRAWRLAPLRRNRAAIWGMGKWAVEQYAKEFGGSRPYFNVPYFSDLHRFSGASAGRQFVSRTRRFLYSGALIKRKGVDLLAAAFAEMARDFPETELAIVGTGNLEAELKARMSHLGERVEFKGFQSWDALPECYAQADVLLAPSRYDGWALVVPEALAAGLPVISTTSTGAAIEFIRTNENGWLIPPGKLEPLRDALRAAASLSGDELRRFSVAARAAVSRHQLSDGVGRFGDALAGSLEPFSR